MAARILVAGLGNIFMGDDAFGVETVRQLAGRPLPKNVRVMDIGIRSYDLSCALLDDPGAVILLDAIRRGERPGTIYLLELHEVLKEAQRADSEKIVANAHTMNPDQALQMAGSICAKGTPIYLVGCEPEILERDDGFLGLSETVQASVPKAIEMIESLIEEILPNKTFQEKNYAFTN